MNNTKVMNVCVADAAERPGAVRPRRILVADDDEAIRDLISTALAGAGFEVKAASDGQLAWEALVHERYDLLVTDNEMPHLPGIELIERIRDRGISVPIIIASGSFPMEKVREHPELQIAAALPKPFRIIELLNAVRQVFQPSIRNATADQRAPDRRQASLQSIRTDLTQ
jgi:CheY-like chemotaxis protein